MPFNGVGASNTELSVGYLSFAVHAMQELAAANPALQSVGYDDGCHLAELLRRHPDPRLRALDVWIDLFHLYGHVRSKCFLHHNPLTRLTADDRVSVTVTSEACRKRLLSHLDGYGKVLRHRSLQARFVWLWQSGRGRSMRLYSVANASCCVACQALAEFAAAPLPISLEIQRPAHATATMLTITESRTRARFLNALDILSGRLFRVIQIQKVRLPRHSEFIAWSRPAADPALAATRHFVSARIDLVDRLARSTLPFVVTFLYGLNTSIAEENWVHFNKFHHTMRAMGRAEYLLFAHRVAHLRNTQMVARRS
jgi:hypothetical protein